MGAVDALLDAGYADCDGLRVVAAHQGYTVSIAGETRGRLDRDAARRRLREHPTHVSNWDFWERTVGGHGTHRRAFLRWLERADQTPVPERYAALRDGLTRTWGEVAITTALGHDGHRRYELRHVEDADAPASDLEARTDPREAREVATADDRGRYRPLKTAPTLPTGWRFVELGPDEAVAAVDFLYPATVANWHLERRGELDVTHWEDAADRQTGIYASVSDLDDEQVRWLATACCVDSQCLKRREWDLRPGEALDVPRGNGEFPCREPCSLVVAAAREFGRIDEGPTERHELDLTPAEREGLDDLIDAVAEGRVDEVREADLDHGANRYRVRYLRAKHGALGQADASR